MVKIIKTYLPWVAVAALLYLWVFKPRVKYVEVPKEIEVEVPVVGPIQTDTVYLPKPYPVIKREVVVDEDLLSRFEKLKGENATLKAYKDAITQRDYSVVFEDSLTDVVVTSKVQGELLEQSLEYTLKPRQVSAVIPPEVTEPKSFFAGGLGIGLPVMGKIKQEGAPVISGSIMFVNKKQNPVVGSLDTEGRLWITKYYKF